MRFGVDRPTGRVEPRDDNAREPVRRVPLLAARLSVSRSRVRDRSRVPSAPRCGVGDVSREPPKGPSYHVMLLLLVFSRPSSHCAFPPETVMKSNSITLGVPGSLQTRSPSRRALQLHAGGHARGGRDALLTRGGSLDAVGPVAPRRRSNVTSFGQRRRGCAHRLGIFWSLGTGRIRGCVAIRASRQGCVAFAAGTRVA